jgi:hypothetical protein
MKEQNQLTEKIKANSALVAREISPLVDFEFGFNARSVAWLDEFIENQIHRPDWDYGTQESLIDVLGSFLGECIISCFGGHWDRLEDQWCISIGTRVVFYPFTKVSKRFSNGLQDSLKVFFDIIPLTFPDDVKLEWHVRQAEAAYGRLYEVWSDTERTAAYSECKESMTEAIRLARQLGLEERVVELEKKLSHYKAVFRSQMSL